MLQRFAKAALAAAVLSVAVAGCSSSTSLITKRTQGYEIPDSALQQIRPGQSQQLVQVVLGSPQSTNSFGDQTAWYYIETKVDRTSFGLEFVKERTVLAIYFDKNKKVVDRAVYSAADGKTVTVESRRTQSFGQDKTFIETILDSF